MLERKTSENEHVKFDFAQRASDAHELWGALGAVHNQLNIVARNGILELSASQKDSLTKLLKRVSALVDAEYLGICPLLDDQKMLTAGDALLLVGQHKAALRIYRVQVLGEDPYSLG